MKSRPRSSFPLVERAAAAGILEKGNALVVAPTSTGKSHIGRAIIRTALANSEPGTHVYLVPYPALAEAVHDAFLKELAGTRPFPSVKVVTGGRTDSPSPEDADILVATYERFSPLLRNPNLKLGRVAVDEFHLLADATMGPLLEELIVRLKFSKPPRSLCALAAVVPKPEPLAKWLGVPLLKGGPKDRPVRVKLSCSVAADVDPKLNSHLKSLLAKGEQAIVFCDSKPSAQKCARALAPIAQNHVFPESKQLLAQLGAAVVEDVEDARELAASLPHGVAAQHTALSRETRSSLESAFLDRHLRVMTGTPAMAGAMAVPAAAVLVRDVFRTEFVRGRPMRVRLSTGELLNLLGHAGHAAQDKPGLGVAFIEKGTLRKSEHTKLLRAVSEGRGEPVVSRLPDSFDALMRLLLAVTADRGTIGLEVLGDALKRSYWYHQQPGKISFNREFKSDIMEDLPSFKKAAKAVKVLDEWVTPDGVAGEVEEGNKKYKFALGVGGMSCECLGMWTGEEVCKHLACAIHYLLFDVAVGDEARGRAVYAAADRFRKTLDVGTKVREAVGLLRTWRLIEFVPGGFKATPIGVFAANSCFDLLLVRTVGERVVGLKTVPSTDYVITWIVEDYFPEEEMEQKWLNAIDPWVKGVEMEKIGLPDGDRGNFYRGLDQLSRIAALCGDIAESMGKLEIAGVYRTTSECLKYGVPPELVPLAAAEIPELARAECQYLYSERGIRTPEGLAKVDPAKLVGPRATLKLTEQWVARAKKMVDGM